MSSKELSRVEVMGRVKAGSLRLREAAELLELSYRQTWLEERGPRGCLMHMADDATSQALGRFEEEETTWGAARVFGRWIER